MGDPETAEDEFCNKYCRQAALAEALQYQDGVFDQHPVMLIVVLENEADDPTNVATDSDTSDILSEEDLWMLLLVMNFRHCDSFMSPWQQSAHHPQRNGLGHFQSPKPVKKPV